MVQIPEDQVRLQKQLEAQFEDKLVHLESHAWKEYGLTFGVKAENAKAVFRTLKENEDFAFNMLIDVTCVDWLDKREPRFDVVYQLLSLKFNRRLCLKIAVEESDPKVSSVTDLWNAANFLEREVWDMFGIVFEGHPDLRRILMYPEFVGHPLRKDYPVRGKQPRVPMRIPELRNTSMDMLRQPLVPMPVRQHTKQS